MSEQLKLDTTISFRADEAFCERVRRHQNRARESGLRVSAAEVVRKLIEVGMDTIEAQEESKDHAD